MPARAALLALVPEPDLSAEQARRYALIRAEPTTAATLVTRLSDAADSLLRSGGAILLELSPGSSVVAVGGPATQSTPAYLSWHGWLRQPLFGQTNLVLGPNGLYGGLWAVPPGAAYRFQPLGEGLHVAVCIDQSKFGPD